MNPRTCTPVGAQSVITSGCKDPKINLGKTNKVVSKSLCKLHRKLTANAIIANHTTTLNHQQSKKETSITDTHSTIT